MLLRPQEPRHQVVTTALVDAGGFGQRHRHRDRVGVAGAGFVQVGRPAPQKPIMRVTFATGPVSPLPVFGGRRIGIGYGYGQYSSSDTVVSGGIWPAVTQRGSSMLFRPLAVAAASVLALTSASAALQTLPGPKPPTEHIGISGGFFAAHTGNPSCWGTGGTAAAAFPVPSGVVLTGATVYVNDPMPSAGMRADMYRHDMASGGSYLLDRGETTGAPGNTTIELEVPAGYQMTVGQAINIQVSVGNTTCLKGAEVHFIRSNGAGNEASQRQAPVPGLAPDGV